MSKLVVLGGSGHLGRRICEAAVSAGWQVVSVSRSGKDTRTRADTKADTITTTRTGSSGNIRWVKGDVLDPSSYQHELVGASAVVHSVGLLLEGDGYKQLLNGKGKNNNKSNGNAISTLCGLKSVLSQSVSVNPLSEKTYSNYNRDSVVEAARATITVNADHNGVNTAPPPVFVHISADDSFSRVPLLPSGYLLSKRQAETGVDRLARGSANAILPLVLRPGFMFDPDEKTHTQSATSTPTLRELLRAGMDLLPARARPFPPAVATTTVAQACIAAINNRQPVTLSNDDIVRLAEQTRAEHSS